MAALISTEINSLAERWKFSQLNKYIKQNYNTFISKPCMAFTKSIIHYTVLIDLISEINHTKNYSEMVVYSQS